MQPFGLTRRQQINNIIFWQSPYSTNFNFTGIKRYCPFCNPWFIGHICDLNLFLGSMKSWLSELVTLIVFTSVMTLSLLLGMKYTDFLSYHILLKAGEFSIIQQWFILNPCFILQYLLMLAQTVFCIMSLSTDQQLPSQSRQKLLSGKVL